MTLYINNVAQFIKFLKGCNLLKLLLILYKKEDEMPVYIWQRDAFRKFVAVESLGDKKITDDMIRHQRESMGMQSFWAFLQKWHEYYIKDPLLMSFGPKFKIESDNSGSNTVIYGYWGWNRWVVYNTGEMLLHRYSTQEEYIKEAKRQGFRIFPLNKKQLSFVYI